MREPQGFSDAQIAATRLADADSDCSTEEERLLLRAVDELCAQATGKGQAPPQADGVRMTGPPETCPSTGRAHWAGGSIHATQ
jgi:hypothetical protein